MLAGGLGSLCRRQGGKERVERDEAERRAASPVAAVPVAGGTRGTEKWIQEKMILKTASETRCQKHRVTMRNKGAPWRSNLAV